MQTFDHPDFKFPHWMGATPRAATFWPPAEDRALREAWYAGMSVEKLARRHGRTVHSICCRLEKQFGSSWRNRSPIMDRIKELKAQLSSIQSQMTKLENAAVAHKNFEPLTRRKPHELPPGYYKARVWDMQRTWDYVNGGWYLRTRISVDAHGIGKTSSHPTDRASFNDWRN